LIRPHLQFAGSPDVFLRYLLQPQPCVHIPTVRRPKRLFPGSALRLAGAAVTIRMRAGATAPATLSLPVPGEGLRAAEDRGFEPRRWLHPTALAVPCRACRACLAMPAIARNRRPGCRKGSHYGGLDRKCHKRAPGTDTQWTRTDAQFSAGSRCTATGPIRPGRSSSRVSVLPSSAK